jgi:rhodanese-related sulfurtransferase
VDQLVNTFLHDRTLLLPIAIEELREGLSAERLLLLDVRPREEYQAGHLPQAYSIPLLELEARLAELPRNREIVAYCRGPYCVFADEALVLLRTHGYSVRRLAEGVLEWQQQGFPIAI